MPERSKRICLYDAEKLKQVNPENMKLFDKYQIDMSIRDLSPNSIKQYNSDLMQYQVLEVSTRHQWAGRDVILSTLYPIIFSLGGH